MKNLIQITIITTSIIFLSSCSSTQVRSSSQNAAINSVTNSNQGKSGAMQESLNNWLKEEWTPTVEKNEEIKEKNLDKSRDFTIQEYVDKATLYIDDHNNTYENSHGEKVSSMPIIGK